MAVLQVLTADVERCRCAHSCKLPSHRRATQRVVSLGRGGTAVCQADFSKPVAENMLRQLATVCVINQDVVGMRASKAHGKQCMSSFESALRRMYTSLCVHSPARLLPD